MTTSTPRTLTDLRSQEFVFTLKKGQAPETVARKFFREVFDFHGEPTIHPLFKEDAKQVWEAYIDAGSVDCIYIIQY